MSSIIPISFDSYLGYSATAGVEAQYGGVSTDPALDARIQGIGKNLIPKTENRNLPYRFKVLDTDSINAFALPGGPVFVNKGLLKIVTDNELASVMGHELGHVNARHGIKGIEQSLGVNIITNVVTAQLKKSKGLNLSPDEINNIDKINNTLGGFVLLGYSREDEYQADAKGLKYMANAGYNPNGAVSLMKKFQDMEGRTPTKLEEFFSTHPSTKGRIDAMQKLINKNFPNAKALAPAGATTAITQITDKVKGWWRYPAVRYGTIAGIGLAGIIISYKLLSMSYKIKGKKHRRNPDKIPIEIRALVKEARKYKTAQKFFEMVYVEVQKTEGKVPFINLDINELSRLVSPGKGWFSAVYDVYNLAHRRNPNHRLNFPLVSHSSLAIGNPSVPEFRSTEEALAYGQSIRGDTIKISERQGLLEEALIDVEGFKRQPDPDFDEWSKAATRVQLIHEALSQATPPPPHI